MERKIEMKIRYFIKKKIETSTHHHHGILKQKFRKLRNTSHTGMNEKMNKIAHHKLTLTHDGSTPKTV
jgi:hypothetical protein